MKYELVEIDLKETTLKKMLTTHSEAGYIIISAFRTEFDYIENVRRNNKLKQDIKNSGYSYIPVWGGYIEFNVKTNKRVETKERSFIVLNYKRGSTEVMGDSKDLKKIGQILCKKYNQQEYLYKPQGIETKAYYLDSNGKKTQVFNSVSPTKSADIYFTNLVKSSKKPVGTKSYTYREGTIWLAQAPNSLSEAYKRMGEIFLRFDD
jgi:hypothetical protein